MRYAGLLRDLLAEVLERVILSVAAKERWNARQLASLWACIVRRSAAFEVSIPTKPNSISSKLRVMSEQWVLKSYPGIKLSLSVLQQFSCCECVSLLR